MTPDTIKGLDAHESAKKLIKIGAKVVNSCRYVMFQMAEVAIPRDIFAELLRRIADLRSPPNSRADTTCFGHPSGA